MRVSWIPIGNSIKERIYIDDIQYMYSPMGRERERKSRKQVKEERIKHLIKESEERKTDRNESKTSRTDRKET